MNAFVVGALSVTMAAVFAFGAAAQAGAATYAKGELGRRIEMVHDRFSKGVIPAFTEDFILADVMLDPGYPRRFAEYSGDISGRYIEALATLPDGERAGALDALVAKLMTYQRPDGRFGNADLSFAAADIAPPNMALLWGNGRLLVGLMAYHTAHPSPEVLECARRLGDFLVGVFETCSRPEVRERLQGKAASGYICFTQLIEGLDMLWRATQDDRYLDTAKKIVPLLEPRGIQHSHGYLTTLRGYAMLSESTGDPQFLSLARQLFDDLVASSDYTIYGGVLEYFGNQHDRDEGCSEADFTRLALQLWQGTGDVRYLDYAERCLLNNMFLGQFITGDFGHRRFDTTGIIPAAGTGRAWWCCTMHGLRAMADVLDSIVTAEDGAISVNMFLEADWEGEGFVLEMRRPAADVQGEGAPSFRIRVEAAPETEKAIRIRKPGWAEDVQIAVNGEAVTSAPEGGCVAIARVWKKGDVVDVSLVYALCLHTRDGKVLTLERLPEGNTEAAVYYGPWLLGVDEAFDIHFHGEPWRDNVLRVSPAPRPVRYAEQPYEIDNPLIVRDAHVEFTYEHGGFPDRATVALRPISEHTAHPQAMHTIWLTFRR